MQNYFPSIIINEKWYYDQFSEEEGKQNYKIYNKYVIKKKILVNAKYDFLLRNNWIDTLNSFKL